MPDAVRFGLVGAGTMGREHMGNVLAVPEAEITAIADPFEGSQEQARQIIGDDLVVFDHHSELIDSGLCDAVIISTPNFTHAEVMLDVMKTDLHLLIEKPLCTTVEDCKRVIEAQEGRNALAWMGLEYRYMAPIARLLDEIRSGYVGTLHMAAIREHRYPFFTKVADWNRLRRNTGGTLVEKCCHFFDLLRLMAEAEPVRVMASGGQSVNHLDEVVDGEPSDIIDNALVVIEFDNGVRGMLDLCMFAEGSKNEQELAATGDKGKVEAFIPDGTMRRATRDMGHEVEELTITDDRVAFEGNHWGSSYLEVLEFTEAIRAGATESAVTLEEGLLSVAMGIAGHMSIDEGRWVELSEVL